VRLLLDEMISFRVEAELRERGHDVEAIKRDRPDLESAPDHEIVRIFAAESRAIVTNNIRDFEPLHRRITASGESHAGMLFTLDATLPRTRAAMPLWIETLAAYLAAHPAEDALRDRIAFLGTTYATARDLPVARSRA
jgi:hypothetical protein